jgi:hypothetical protein
MTDLKDVRNILRAQWDSFIRLESFVIARNEAT